MAYASDRLRERRMKKMDAPDGDDSGDKAKAPSDRVIMLTPEELKSLAGTYQEGAEAVCEVHGRIDKDGNLSVNSVQPAGGGDGGGGSDMPAPPMRMNPAMMPG